VFATLDPVALRCTRVERCDFVFRFLAFFDAFQRP
jgi:hypothetical protein